MRNAILILIFGWVLTAALPAFSQDTNPDEGNTGPWYGQLSFGVLAPFGDLSDQLEMALGSRVALERSLFKEFTLLAGVGFYHFMDSEKSSSTNQIPLDLAFRAYLTEKHNGFFGELQAGGVINLTSYDITDAESETEFWPGLTPRIGYYFTPRFSFSVMARYMWAPERDRMIVGVRPDYFTLHTLPKAEFYYLGADFTYTW